MATFSFDEDLIMTVHTSTERTTVSQVEDDGESLIYGLPLSECGQLFRGNRRFPTCALLLD
jgi:hypothetical protein